VSSHKVRTIEARAVKKRKQKQEPFRGVRGGGKRKKKNWNGGGGGESWGGGDKKKKKSLDQESKLLTGF